MAGTIVADNIQAASTSTLVIKNGVANTPPTIQDSAGTQIGTFCRAWVNFNGTGTVAIRASFNVSSITDNGTGDYTVNFTTAMADANFSVVGAEQFTNDNRSTFAGRAFEIRSVTTPLTTTSCRIGTGSTASPYGLDDCLSVYVSIFR
jgi:hypothetical protein